MSGADKIPPLGRFHADLRLFSGRVHANLQQQSPSVSATVPPPHPFIAHFYPVASGVEQLSPGLPLPNPSVSQQPSSAAALVALATSGCRGQNLSSQLLQSFQSKAQQLANGLDPKANFSGESKPSTNNQRQFDVDSSTDKSLASGTAASDLSGFSPFQSGFNASPLHSAWELLRRLNNRNFAGASAAEHSAELLRSYYAAGHPVFPTSPASPAPTGSCPPGSELFFPSQGLDSPMFSAPLKERWYSDERKIKKRKLSPGAIRRSSTVASSPEHDSLSVKFSSHSNSPSNEPVKSETYMRTESFEHSSLANGCDEKEADFSLDPSARSSSASSVHSHEELPRNRRRKRSNIVSDTCPVCGITVRPAELPNHMRQELENLERLPSETRKKSTTFRRSSTERRAALKGESSSATSATSSNKRLSNRDLSPRTNRANRAKTYRKIQCNRAERMNTRIGHRLHSHVNGTCSTPSCGPGNRLCLQAASETMNMSSSCCPVCSRRLSGTLVSINDHVEDCLRQKRNASHQAEDEDEVIDVESNVELRPNCAGNLMESNEDDRSSRSFGSEYEWCGQSRVRSTALLDRQNLATSSGFQLVRPASPGGDQFLNVETDDTQAFGPAQFTEEDLAACREKYEGTNRTATTSSEDERGRQKMSGTSEGDDGESAKSHLDDSSEKGSSRCMICMDPYTDPVTSIQCWHVHCKSCWLRVLSIKKLCPRCNAITPADKLRRIYL